ncbi:MAG TPA: M20 family metallopeptidase [Burkholderiaceae bacterium]|nr:M20 family metallopeptidase [Burkholderiaceae bacterium]
MTATAIDPVALTCDLLRIDTINPPGNEIACARLLGERLERAGFAVSYHEYAPGRATLVARIGGGADFKPLGMTGHLDIVPLGTAAWSHDPFAAEIDGDRLYGRGSSDMKSGVAAMVAAAIERSDDLRRSRGLVLILTAGEETGCDGAFHLVRSRGFDQPLGALLVAEPTANQPMAGHKGALWLRALTSGVTAHGSMPDQGVNAIYPLAGAIAKLQEFSFDSTPHPVMGSPTLNVGTFRGGLNINSVPDAAVAEIDLRTVSGMRHDALFESVGRYLGSAIRLERMIDLESVYTDPSDPWLARACEIAAEVTGDRERPKTMMYFTDASALTPALGHPPTLILGPGEPTMAHKTDEYCRVSRVAEAAEIYRRMIGEWCRG